MMVILQKRAYPSSGPVVNIYIFQNKKVQSFSLESAILDSGVDHALNEYGRISTIHMADPAPTTFGKEWCHRGKAVVTNFWSPIQSEHANSSWLLRYAQMIHRRRYWPARERGIL
ncbi:hypothetical protein [Rhizobium herbae]|uniref:Uncharacterized protein n=1 Tax=Rhizobium herbae TaxID=508661 RepID=A0ABS4EQ08_9HYPH|nr:hypothetical protein [Rhizobium herbae]MBP1860030.1 hypothetical protein [Rhizobium herbae]